jgi:hypothetical protein
MKYLNELHDKKMRIFNFPRNIVGEWIKEDLIALHIEYPAEIRNVSVILIENI